MLLLPQMFKRHDFWGSYRALASSDHKNLGHPFVNVSFGGVAEKKGRRRPQMEKCSQPHVIRIKKSNTLKRCSSPIMSMKEGQFVKMSNLLVPLQFLDKYFEFFKIQPSWLPCQQNRKKSPNQLTWRFTFTQPLIVSLIFPPRQWT